MIEQAHISKENVCCSPTFDIIRVADIFGIKDEVKEFVLGTSFYTKRQWKDLVWERAWAIEKQDWDIRKILFKSTKYLRLLLDDVHILVWWRLGDKNHDIMTCCETMVKIICKSSK